MCQFHSITVNRNCTIAHVASNSHSVAVQAKGWKENTSLPRRRFWEFEMDPYLVEPTYENILRHDIDPDEIPEKVMKAALRHYQEVWNCLEEGTLPEKFQKPEYADVREKLAQNSNLTEETQMILAKDGDYRVRWYLAGNSNLTEETQMILAKDEDSKVRCWLAENPNLTEETQMILAKDEDYWVRAHLARNPNLTEETQMILAKDEDSLVRRYLAINSNLIEKAQMILIKDEDCWVRENLAINSNLTEKARKLLNE